MTKVNIWYAAGLGDILMSYASLASESGRVLSFKEQYPDSSLRAVICTVSDRVPDLFAHCPHFSEVSYHTWVTWHDQVRRDQAQGHPYLADLNHSHLQPRRLPFYLSDEERAIAASIEARPYVGVHFFAGSSDRNWFQRIRGDGASRVIHAILDRGLDVALLGGSSKRQEGEHIADLHEQFPFARAGVHNLLGRYSVRLHAHLASHAAALVGTMSCYISLGTQFVRPSFVVAPPFLRPWFQREDGGVFRDLERQRAVLNFWDSADTLGQELADLDRFLDTVVAKGKSGGGEEPLKDRGSE
jgi:hypothetical protein